MHLLAAALYVALSARLWQTRWRTRQPGADTTSLGPREGQGSLVGALTGLHAGTDSTPHSGSLRHPTQTTSSSGRPHVYHTPDAPQQLPPGGLNVNTVSTWTDVGSLHSHSHSSAQSPSSSYNSNTGAFPVYDLNTSVSSSAV